MCYFGGIKFGYGGLVKVYSDVVSLVIENVGIVEVYEMECFEVIFFYNFFYIVRSMIEENGGRVVGEEYGEFVKFMVEIRKGEVELLMEFLIERIRGRVRLRLLFMRSV